MYSMILSSICDFPRCHHISLSPVATKTVSRHLQMPPNHPMLRIIKVEQLKFDTTPKDEFSAIVRYNRLIKKDSGNQIRQEHNKNWSFKTRS